MLLINETLPGKLKKPNQFSFYTWERERVRAGNREKKINSDKRGETNAG